MSEITIQASSNPITVSATSGTVSATVAAATTSITTTGGVGPQGPSGTDGGPITQLSDVQIVGLTDGDVLTYSTQTETWTNADALDGGNW